jgi:hypothetical protein
MRIAGALLLGGGIVSIGLSALGLPEDLLRFLYDTLLSGLDVPEEPSRSAVDVVEYVAWAGGLLELLAGAVLLVIARRRGR